MVLMRDLRGLRGVLKIKGPQWRARPFRSRIGWYVKSLQGGEAFRAQMNALVDAEAQLRAVGDFFDGLSDEADRMPAVDAVDNKKEEEVCI